MQYRRGGPDGCRHHNRTCRFGSKKSVFRLKSSVFRFEGVAIEEFSVSGSGCGVLGLEFSFQDARCRMPGVGIRV